MLQLLTLCWGHAAGICHFLLCLPLAGWAGSGVLYSCLSLQSNDRQGNPNNHVVSSSLKS